MLSYCHRYACADCGTERTWGHTDTKFRDPSTVDPTLLCEGTCKTVVTSHGRVISSAPKPTIHVFVSFKTVGAIHKTPGLMADGPA